MNMIEALLNFRNRPIPGENRAQFRDPISQMLLMMGQNRDDEDLLSEGDNDNLFDEDQPEEFESFVERRAVRQQIGAPNNREGAIRFSLN